MLLRFLLPAHGKILVVGELIKWSSQSKFLHHGVIVVVVRRHWPDKDAVHSLECLGCE